MTDVVLLGPVELRASGQLLDLGPPKRQAVFAALAVDAGRPVTVDTLVDRVWDEAPPAEARNALYAHIVRIRRVLDRGAPAGGAPPRLERRAGGYLLDIDTDRVDLHRFRRLADLARDQRLDDGERVKLLHEALGLWRGTPLAGLPGSWAGRVREGCRQHRLDTVLALAAAELRIGDQDAVIAGVHDLISEYPLVEPLTAMLMRALHDAGRTAEALDCFARFRERLADELGIDPGPELQGLHQAILRGVVDRPAPRPAPGRTVPAQLPADVRGFAGRADELARLDAVLATADQQPTSVLVTAVCGPAGVGKTALALHWAHRVAHRFPDGQLYVNLRGFDPSGTAMGPAEAVRRFLDALQVPPQRIPADLEAQVGLYRSLLAGKRVLVVLDNARDADQVRPLLPGSPACLVVVTSRDQLTGLVATEGAAVLTLDLLSVAEARDLLARRLGDDRVAAEPAAVDGIISACSRLPLALGVVAARAATHPRFPLGVLADELRGPHGGLDAFAGGDPASDVRAVFATSYRTLGVPAARLFRLLGLHSGPDISAPAAASLVGLPAAAVRPLLRELTRAHLLAEHSPGRYACHDLLRAYAAELLTTDTDPERQAALRRVLDHYLHTAHQADQLLDPHRDPIPPPAPAPGAGREDLADHPSALAWLTAEHAVLAGAVEQAAREGLDCHAWHLAASLTTFLDWQGHPGDLVAVQTTALAAAARLADQGRQARAQRALAQGYARLGRYDDAGGHLRQAAETFGRLGDLAGQADVSMKLGWVADLQGRQDEARRHALRALEEFRAAGHKAGQAYALGAIGWSYAEAGDHRRALAYCQEAIALNQAIDNRYGEGSAWDSLGLAHHHLGNYREAVACYRRGLSTLQTLGVRSGQSIILHHLGDTHRAAGDLESARDAWQRALVILEETADPDADQVRAKLGQLWVRPT